MTCPMTVSAIAAATGQRRARAADTRSALAAQAITTLSHWTRVIGAYFPNRLLEFLIEVEGRSVLPVRHRPGRAPHGGGPYGIAKRSWSPTSGHRGYLRRPRGPTIERG